MSVQTISHYAPKAHPPLADKILEKPRHKDGGQVGEGGPILRLVRRNISEGGSPISTLQGIQ